ncbi:MAG: DUF1028 domain-containing protein [Acidocella sp.]|nr:DUF1028 domain-containing protein [Acidocella sp.]
MTFSVAARCERTGQFAVAVASSSPAVAARCAHAQAELGAVTTQNITDPRLGPTALKLMARGLDAEAACARLQIEASFPAYRQFILIDKQGNTAAFSGARSLGIYGHAQGRDVVSAGNLLSRPDIPDAIIASFMTSDAASQLGARVLLAMRAGLLAGGEAGPIRSAGLILVDREAWPLADLRVDWHDTPLNELIALWALWEPQMHDYVIRAIDPSSAPTFGVPGDL